MLEPVAKGIQKKYQTRSQEGSQCQNYSQRSFKYNPYYSDLETDFDVEYCVDQLCSYLRRTNHISLTVVRDFRTHLEYDRRFSERNKNLIPDPPLQLQRLLLEVSSKPKSSDSNQVSSDSNSKLSDSKAESSDANLESSDPNPNDSNPELSNLNLESSALNAISSDSNPELSDSKPESIDANLESSDPNLESNDSNPELSNLNLESSALNAISSDTKPKSSDSKSESSDAHLESSDPNPKANDSNPELNHSNVESSASNLELSDSKLESSDANPESNDPNPGSNDSNTELSHSNVESSASNAISSDSNPESSNSNQESSPSPIGGSPDSREQSAESDRDVTDEAEGSTIPTSSAALTLTRDLNSSPPAKKPDKEEANISGALKEIFVQYFERLWRCLYVQKERRSSVYVTVLEKKFSLQSYIMAAGIHIQCEEESWFRAPPTSSTRCDPEKSLFKVPQPLRLNNRTASSAR